MAQSALSQPRHASKKGGCRHACTCKVGCLPREFDQFRNMTSEINEGDPALLEGHVRNRGDDQTPTRRGHTGDRSVEVNDFEGEVDEAACGIPVEECPQG